MTHPPTGRWLECFTNQPGCQFYTGNFVPTDERWLSDDYENINDNDDKISSLRGKEGAIYKKHGGFCLETQKFPDSINQPNFPRLKKIFPWLSLSWDKEKKTFSCVVRPGEVYNHTVVYKVGSKWTDGRWTWLWINRKQIHQCMFIIRVYLMHVSRKPTCFILIEAKSLQRSLIYTHFCF